jgi:hypothetical protein
LLVGYRLVVLTWLTHKIKDKLLYFEILVLSENRKPVYALIGDCASLNYTTTMPDGTDFKIEAQSDCIWIGQTGIKLIFVGFDNSLITNFKLVLLDLIVDNNRDRYR